MVHWRSANFVQRLESRVLLSAATLAQDQQQLQADQATYAADTRQCKTLIAHDRAQVSADSAAGRVRLAALLRQLQRDQAVRKTTLAADRSNDKVAEGGDKAVILRDKVAVRVDKNNASQLAVDTAKFAADGLMLQSDHVKFTTIFLDDDAATQSAVLVDQQAIVTSRATADNSPLQGAQQTLLADQQACLKTLAADQIAILKDHYAIAKDGGAS